MINLNNSRLINEIVKRILFYMLIISLIVNGYFILKSYYLDKSMLNNKIPDVKVIPKREYIRVKGKVKTKEIEKPYEIVLEEKDGEIKLNEEMSNIPDGFLTVDKVSKDSKFMWLKPFRLGISASWDKKITYYPTLSYNPLKWGDFELGVKTNFKSLGLGVGYEILDSNFIGNATYYLDNTISVGISVKVW